MKIDAMSENCGDPRQEQSQSALLLPRPHTERGKLWAGFFFAQIWGFLQIALTTFVMDHPNSSILGLGQFGAPVQVTLLLISVPAVPFIMGFVASYFWYDLPNVTRRLWFYGFLNFIIGCLSGGLLQGHGYEAFCFLGTAPLFWPLLTGGIGIGLNFWRKLTC